MLWAKVLPVPTFCSKHKTRVKSLSRSQSIDSRLSFWTLDSAPSQLPGDIRVHSQSSTSIRVNWNFAGSRIAGFYIGFRPMIHDLKPQSVYSFKTMQLDSNSSRSQREFEAVLSDLKRNTGYGIIVQAFNHKGSGPASEEVIGHTKEFGATFCCCTIDHHSLFLPKQTLLLSSTSNSCPRLQTP